MQAAQRLVRFLLVVFLVTGLFGCDHATKLAAKASLQGAPAVPVALGGAVELVYTQNDDIAFSALHRLGLPRSPGLLIAVGVLAVLGIVVTLLRRQAARVLPVVGGAFVLAGALGNLVDRATRGYVIDFIHVRGWPVFNVADIAVCVGVGLIILGTARRRSGPASLSRPPSLPGS